MNSPGTKRLGRILSLERKKMDAAVLQLKKLNQQLDAKRIVLAKLQKHLIDSLDESETSISISQRLQHGRYSGYIDAKIATQLDEAQTIEEEQQAMVSILTDQKAAVQGWEILVDKLKFSIAEVQNKIESFTADDRFLSSRTKTRK